MESKGGGQWSHLTDVSVGESAAPPVPLKRFEPVKARWPKGLSAGGLNTVERENCCFTVVDCVANKGHTETTAVTLFLSVQKRRRDGPEEQCPEAGPGTAGAPGRAPGGSGI